MSSKNNHDNNSSIIRLYCYTIYSRILYMSLLDSISSVPETLKELVKNHYIKIIILIAIFTAVSVFYYQRVVVPRFQKQYVENIL